MVHLFPPPFRKAFLSVLVLLLVCCGLQAHAQTPGLIFQPATGSGRNVLDPNLDNYTSKTSTGYVGTNDIGSAVNEIAYRLLPQYSSEPSADLSTGSAGGHTDQVANPLYMAYNGTQVLFRVRLGGNSSASKGYSFLIDSDGVFNKQRLANGTLVDFTTSSKVKNLGFEYEVVLALNFDVVVYRHRGSGDDSDPFTSNVIWRGSANGGYSQYFQKAIAATKVNGDADYFFDFYVPLTAFSGDGGAGISPSTPLRVTGSTVTSAQTGLEGTISDIGGVNDNTYGNDKYRIWREVVPAFPPTSLNQIQAGEFCQTAAPAAPVITTSPIRVGTTSITVTSIESGSTVTLYKNGTQIIGTSPTTITGGTYTFQLSGSSILAAGDVLTARVTRASSGSCPELTSVSSNSVTVGMQDISRCSTPAPFIGTYDATTGAVLTNGYFNSNQQSINITSRIQLPAYPTYTASNPSPLKVYRDGVYYPGTYEAPATRVINGITYYVYVYTPTNCTKGNFSFSYSCGSNTNTNNYGTLTATITNNNCESPRSNTIYIVGGSSSTSANNTTTTSAPTISNSFYCASTTSLLQGTNAVANGPIYLYVNRRPITTTNGNLEPTTTALADGTWSINLSLYQLVANDTVVVRTKAGGLGLSGPSNQIIIGANCITATPSIASTTLCPTATSITGTSTESAGTTILVYRRVGTSPNPATDPRVTEVATVANGTWSAPVLGSANLKTGDVLYAVATAPGGKTASAASSTVTVAGSSTATSYSLTISSPIRERATIITGSSRTNGTVYLYIDGQRIGGTATISSITTSAPVATWSIAINSTNQLSLSAGASVTASILPTVGGCESQQTAAVLVSCSAPSTAPALAPAAQTVCQNSPATLTVSNSENGVIYQIYNGTEPSGPSMVGNGSTITLASKPLTAPTVLTFRAFNVNTPDCQATLTGSTSITIAPTPMAYAVTLTTTSVCNGASATVTVANSEEDASYQIQVLNAATGTYTSTGTAVAGTGGALTLSTSTLTSSGTFKVVATRNGCSSDMGNTFTVTVPSNALTISPAVQSICAGNTASVLIRSAENGVSYQLQRLVGSTFTSTGTAMTGKGSDLILSTDLLSATGANTFRVLATSGQCTPFTLTQQFTVTVTSATPTAFAVTPATSTICSGQAAALSLAGSEQGITYQIFSGTTAIGNPVAGTGSALTLSTGVLTTSGTYTIVASNACGGKTTMTGSSQITVNPAPTVFAVTPATQTVCNNSAATITLAGSETGVRYQIQVYNPTNQTYTNTGTALDGTGNPIALTTGLLTTNANLKVVATRTGSSCSVDMGNRVFVAVPSNNLTVAAITPSICSGGTAQIRVSNSETEVFYQLRVGGINGTNVGVPIEGTGGEITLVSNAITANTTFTVVALPSTPAGCSFAVGSTVTVNVAAPAPQTIAQAPASSICSGATASIGLASSEVGVTYQIYVGGTSTGFGIAGTGSAITLNTGPLTSTSTIQVYAIRSGCASVAMGSAYTVNVNSTPTRLTFTSTQQTLCAGGTVSINLSSSQSGVTYQIYNGATPSGSPASSSTGGSITLTSGPINSSATLTVQAIGSGNCGNVTLDGYVAVTVPQIIANAGPAQQTCAGTSAAPKTVTMNATPATNGTGIWTLRDQPPGTPAVTITNPTSPTTTVTGLTAGEYVFTWTVTFNNSCGTAFEDVTIHMDCPTDKEVVVAFDNSGKPADKYTNRETLITFADNDASLLGFYVSESDVIPGVSYEIVDGILRMYVSDKNLLKEGNYTPTIRTTDALGGVSFLKPTLLIGTPLPVTLIHFAAVSKQGNITLNWTTASEKDNDYFLVERSQDGKNFSAIGKAQGNGTTNVLQNYSFQDTNAPAGTLYYRLKQVDYDSKFEYSKVVSVKTVGTEGPNAQLKIVRNPFKEVVQVEITASQSETVQIELVDLRGKVLLREELRVTTGTTNWQHHTATLPAGVYLLKVIGSTIKEVTRVVKVD